MSDRLIRQPNPMPLMVLMFLLVASTVGGLIGRPVVAVAEARPDIVLVLSDDMNDDDWRSLPKAKAFLPAEFPNYINTDPLCCPSRASILTGLYPHNHGTWGNDTGPSGGWQSFRNREDATIATMLSKSGYRTGLIGKYLNNYEPKAGPRPGWDYWFAFGKPEYKPFDAVEGHKVKTWHKYSTDVVATKATAFIASSGKATPLFAYVTPKPPHAPTTPPKRYAKDCRNDPVPVVDKPSFHVKIIDGPAYVSHGMSHYDKSRLVHLDRKRQCALKALDDLIVDVHAALEKRGRPYYLFVASDNGYLLGEHGGVGKRAPYDESTRTMMRATSGGGAPAITGSDHLVANIDWMATFAELSGATPPYQTDGQSILTGPERDLIVIESKKQDHDDVRDDAFETLRPPSYRGCTWRQAKHMSVFRWLYRILHGR
ncbi:MAG: sulfatase-like hydrolase/transferase [Thermomicrobiales bacterium]